LSNVTVLYHAGCPDGFGSAWSFYKKYGTKAEYIPVRHGDLPPDVTGKTVFIVDFSYPRTILEEMHAAAESLTVIDHHITAQESLHGLDYCHFDMSHSGAYLSWAFLFGEEDVPLLIRYIEDRDLWKWQLPSAEQILSAIDSYDKSFSTWDSLNEKLDEPHSRSWFKLHIEGSAILRYNKQLIERLKKKEHTVKIGDDTIRAVNSPFFQSEIGAQLSRGEKYAAVYYYDGEKYVFSLRSDEDGENVSVVAKKFGGGGHKKASGFSVMNISDLEK
jgi:nanoRNase/pAp phosphatase (c-di-AMP/oligoRNAs hydrolase)